MQVDFDLNRNDAEALLQHCLEHTPATGDSREDSRLRDALEALKDAIFKAMGGQD